MCFRQSSVATATLCGPSRSVARIAILGYGIALDGSENVYAAGIFQGTADFDPGPGVFNLVPDGERDTFLAKIAPPGCPYSLSRKEDMFSASGGNGSVDIPTMGDGSREEILAMKAARRRDYWRVRGVCEDIALQGPLAAELASAPFTPFSQEGPRSAPKVLNISGRNCRNGR